MKDPDAKTEHMIKTGIVGSIAISIFWFTPLISSAFKLAGWSFLTPYFAFLFAPLLGYFLFLTIYGGWKWYQSGLFE